MMESKMTISQRLYLSFSLLTASLVALTITSVLVVKGFQDRFEFMQLNVMPSIVILDDIVNGSNRVASLSYRYILMSDQQKRELIKGDIYKYLSSVKKQNTYYLDNYVANPEDKRRLQEELKLLSKIETQFQTFLKDADTGNNEAALNALQSGEGYGASIRHLISEYQSHVKFNVDIGKNFSAHNTRIYSKTLWSLILGSLSVTLILGFCTFKTITGIRRNLNSIRSTMEVASTSLDLTLQADTDRKDEIGLTALAFNNLIKSVSSSLATVDKTAQSVSTASAQITAGNEDLSSRTEEQAASLEQTAASMTQLSETVRQTAENTKHATELSKSASKMSEDSSVRVDEMLVTMSDIRSSARKITEIITLIEGVAFQTNILALNAAVEAARAGEQGRGFAVVAGEVRNLAQRSSSSAKEIKELIESSMHYVEKGASQAEAVGLNVQQVNRAVRQVTELVDEISVAASEQAEGINQVHLAVNQMDEVTQQNASLVEEISSASRSLQEQALSLNELVKAFTIK